MQIVVIENQPYEGAAIGDPYIDLVLNDSNNSHIYIPANNLVDVYTAGMGIEIVENAIVINLSPTEAHGLFLSDDGLGLNLATTTTAGAMSAEDKQFIVSAPYTLEYKQYEVSSAPIGTLVNHHDKEIRIMVPANTEFKKQSVGANGDANKYYIGFRAYAPTSDVVSFKEDLAETINDDTMYYFEGNDFAGIDEYGRKYSIIWLGVAAYDETSDSWSYYGNSSTDAKYIGWYYSVDWYNADGVVVASDCIRINLSNESCHNSIAPSYVSGLNTKITEIESTLTVLEQAATWSEM